MDQPVATHPAYGFMTFHKYANASYRKLFMSNIRNQQIIELKIYDGETIGNVDNLHACQASGSPIITIELSQEQLTNFLITGDTPVTLCHVEGREAIPKMPEPKSISTEFKKRVQYNILDIEDRIKEVIEMIEDTTMPKGKREKVLHALNTVTGSLQNNSEYFLQAFSDAMEKIKHSVLVDCLRQELKEK